MKRLKRRRSCEAGAAVFQPQRCPSTLTRLQQLKRLKQRTHPSFKPHGPSYRAAPVCVSQLSPSCCSLLKRCLLHQSWHDT